MRASSSCKQDMEFVSGLSENAWKHLIKFFCVSNDHFMAPGGLEDFNPDIVKTFKGLILSLPMIVPHFGPAPDHRTSAARCVMSWPTRMVTIERTKTNHVYVRKHDLLLDWKLRHSFYHFVLVTNAYHCLNPIYHRT